MLSHVTHVTHLTHLSHPSHVVRACALLIVATTCLVAESASVPPVTAAAVDGLIAQGQDWLLAQQDPSGSFGKADAKMALGITALVTAALTQDPSLPSSDARLAKAIAYLRAHQRPDGGFYLPEEGLAVYGTAMALTALVQAQAADPATLAKAQAFLRAAQVSDPASPSAGGIGYGGPTSPTHADLSNTHMALRALRLSGVPASDPVIQKAIPFLEHCQELSAVNHLPWVDMSPASAGGGVYNPDPQPRHNPADPTAAPIPPAKPSAYGSMTFALYDGYQQAGVAPADPRATQALAWVASHYTITENPGRAAGKNLDGLYYYYWMMAETLTSAGQTSITLPSGQRRDWRADILSELTTREHLGTDGTGAYWINGAKMWSETNPLIVTSYVVQTLKCLRHGL